jgi:hypothetical protein
MPPHFTDGSGIGPVAANFEGRESQMRRRIVAIVLALMALGLTAPIVAADGGPCAPGQHGNQDPGFKPPSCPH